MNKKVVILGSGESGMGAALLAKKMGYDVFLSDSAAIPKSIKQILYSEQITFEEKKHNEFEIFKAEVVVKSPGIPDDIDLIKRLNNLSISVISEIEFAFKHSKSQIIAVTGSNGKTTTASLIYHILKNLKKVSLAGNIGYGYARSVFERDSPLFVLEVSSFQLDGILEFRPHIAILTNITTDHLERYENNFDNYVDSKFKITSNQTHEDYLIYDADDTAISSYIEKKDIKASLVPFSIRRPLEYGIYFSEKKIIVNMKSPYTISLKDMHLQGNHNYKNAMAAVATTEILEIDRAFIKESLKSFQGVEHRLEIVGEVGQVRYINDSKATNVNAVYYALESMRRPTIWILGGIDKGNDYKELLALVVEKVKAIICLGKDNRKIIEQFRNIVPYMIETQSMEEAVRVSYSISENGDGVLLSPACASFDLFKNYEDRGIQFKKAVNNLSVKE